MTFPLVFGWIHFESQADAPQVFQILVFGVRVAAFDTEFSWMRYVFFNVLNLSAVLVIVGVGLTLHRRLKSRAAMAGMSLSDYLLNELREVAERPTLDELRARLRNRSRTTLSLDPAAAVRAERDSR